MEHAAQGVVEAIARYADKGTVVFLCGPGNNGGDGYAAARLWAARGGKAHIVEVTDNVRGDALLNRNLAKLLQIPFQNASEYEELPPCDVIVDALFGTGLSRAVDGYAGALIHWANDRNEFSGTPVIAVDIPSGIDGATGEVLGWEATKTLEDMCRDAWAWQSKNPMGYDSE